MLNRYGEAPLELFIRGFLLQKTFDIRVYSSIFSCLKTFSSRKEWAREINENPTVRRNERIHFIFPGNSRKHPTGSMEMHKQIKLMGRCLNAK